jgi:glycosyltransferase involved in cell wall biosynthesis
MSDGPRVSFILPIYNAGKTLAETLESLFSQTFEDFEIVAVNDGSTDETEAVLRGVRDRRLRVIGRENRGLVASLNEAIDAARGALLARIDADDLCMPERLEKQIAFLEKNPRVGVVGTAIETFGGGAGVVTYPERPGATMLFRSAMAHPTVMIRKAMLEACGLRYREPYRCAQDYDLWCRCVRREVDIMNMPDVLVRYRLHAGQITHALAEPTQVEGEAIRCEFVQSLLPQATEQELRLHNAIARNQLETTQAFVNEAAAWLTNLMESATMAYFFEPKSLVQVLTGRFVSICRFARESGLVVPAPGAFAGHIHRGALD